MDRGQAADDRAIADRDVTAESDAVDQCDVVTDLTVMSDMGPDHQETIGTHLCFHVAALGPAMNGHVLADERIGTDGERAGLVRILYVLRREAERGEGKNLTACADRGPAFYNNMGVKNHIVSQLDVGADDTIGSDLYIRANFCAWIDLRGHMNIGHEAFGYSILSTITALTSASATRLPSTSAWARKRQTRPRLRIF